MTKKLEGALIRGGANLRWGSYQIWSLRGGANPREGPKPNKYGIYIYINFPSIAL